MQTALVLFGLFLPVIAYFSPFRKIIKWLLVSYLILSFYLSHDKFYLYAITLVFIPFHSKAQFSKRDVFLLMSSYLTNWIVLCITILYHGNKGSFLPMQWAILVVYSFFFTYTVIRLLKTDTVASVTFNICITFTVLFISIILRNLVLSSSYNWF